MGSGLSKASIARKTAPFEKEIGAITEIVDNLVREDGLFRRGDYTMLTAEVCTHFNLVLEKSLRRHLRHELEDVGTSLILIPKSSDSFTLRGMSKKDLCERIATHFGKVLTLLTAIKLVFDAESRQESGGPPAGSNSIIGIIANNISFPTQDTICIEFCASPHSDYELPTPDRMDFAGLSGLKLLTEKVLPHSDAERFLDLLQALLARHSRNALHDAFCRMRGSADPNEFSKLESLFMERVGATQGQGIAKASPLSFATRGRRSSQSRLVCVDESVRDATSVIARQQGAEQAPPLRDGLVMMVEKMNPVLSGQNQYCYAHKRVIASMKGPDGRRISALYAIMRRNYMNSLREIKAILDEMVAPLSTASRYEQSTEDKTYELKYLTSKALDALTARASTVMKMFYLRSISDYQRLLDATIASQGAVVDAARTLGASAGDFDYSTNAVNLEKLMLLR